MRATLTIAPSPGNPIGRRRRADAARVFSTVLLLALAGSAKPTGADAFRDCAGCPLMRSVEAGRFVMGSADGEAGRPEGPVHAVDLQRAFALAVTETTVAQFRRFVTESGYSVERGCRVYLRGAWQESADHDWRDPGPGLAYGDDFPVVCVSWNDARAYTRWLSRKTARPYRLPSEAEWEYAARAGAAGAYAWGEDANDACVHANVYDQSALAFAFPWPAAACTDGFASLAPVGSFAPNAFGIRDLHGNVWEWVADCYQAPYPARDDPQRALKRADGCERRSVRGGSWMTRMSRQRAAFRGRDPAHRRMAYFGFRVAAELAGD